MTFRQLNENTNDIAAGLAATGVSVPRSAWLSSQPEDRASVRRWDDD